MSQVQGVTSQARNAGGKTATKSAEPRKFTGPVRIKYLPPTVEEAVLAAQGLADDVEGQIEIAAGLMGVEPDEVRNEVLRLSEIKQAEEAKPRVVVRDRTGGERAVVVQRAGRLTRSATVERRSEHSAQRPAAVVERTRPAIAGRLSMGSVPGKVRTFDLTRNSR